MARPYWQGSIQISLVSAQVSLFPASNSARSVQFHQIDRKTGERIHHQNVVTQSDEPDDSEAVSSRDVIKGYEYEKDKYVPIEPDEIKRLRLKSQKTLEIAQFVNSNEVDLEYFEKPYFVVPRDNAQAKVLAILRKALEESSTIGLGEITFSGREHLVAIAPPVSKGVHGLMLYVMRYEEELRDPKEYYSDIAEPKVDEKQLTLARQLIESYRAPFDPAQFKDDYETALRELVDAKLKGKKLPSPQKEPKKAKVIDLMDALKKSIASRQPTGKTSDEGKSASARKKSAAKKGKAA